VALVFINQLRQKLQFGYSMGRPQMVMIGEHPLTYWSSLKIHLQQSERLGPKDEPDGIAVNCEVLKNTTAPPFRKCQFEIDFKTGVRTVDSALDLAIQTKLVTGNAGWYKFGEMEKPFRRQEFGEVLAAHEDLRRMLDAAPLLWAQGD
jgi:hypothetical protein